MTMVSSDTGNLSGNIQTGCNDLDHVILNVFEEVEDVFSFPVLSQKEARAFVRNIHGRGVSYETISEEIGEHIQLFNSWRKSLGRQGIGIKVLDRINKPLNDLLEEDDYVWNPNGESKRKELQANNERNHQKPKTEEVKNKNGDEKVEKEEKKPEEQPKKTVETYINGITENIIQEVIRKSPSVSCSDSSSGKENEDSDREDSETEENTKEQETTRTILTIEEEQHTPSYGMKSVSPSIEERIEKMKNLQSNNSHTTKSDTGNIFLKEPLKKLNSAPAQRKDAEQKPDLNRATSEKEHSFFHRGTTGGSVTDIINALNKHQLPTAFKKYTSSGSSSGNSSRNQSPVTVSTSSSSSPQQMSPVHTTNGSSNTRNLIEEFEHLHDEVIHNHIEPIPEKKELNEVKTHVTSRVLVSPDHSQSKTFNKLSTINKPSDDRLLTSVGESYDSDLDEENSEHSQTFAEQIKRLHAVKKTSQHLQTKQPIYLYVLTDIPERKEFGRVKLCTSRYPHKRLKQAQMFNPDIRLFKSVEVSDRLAAFDEAKLSLLECKELSANGTDNSNSNGHLIGNWFTDQSLMDVTIILEEVEEKYAVSGSNLQSLHRQQDESEC